MGKIRVHDGSLHYTVQGSGTPLIFIHPPMLSGANFKYQLDELSNDFTVIAFDIRGHGKSEPSRQPLTYPLIVEDMKEIMNHLQVEKAFVCGYSTGGSIALEFLLTAPERALGGILVGGISEVNTWWLKNRITVGMVLANAGAISPLAFSIAWSNSDTPSTFQALVRDAKKTNKKNVGEYYRYSLMYNCTSRLHNISLPLLLVYGGKDKKFHPYGNVIHKNVTHSEFTLISNVKHQIPTKKPKELNHLIKNFILASKR
ncbi:pimeloyl-ACP methyl ester carboxylesterase [Aneurinibacillus soli]|uniref:AB hydrolase superfamily protein YvaM n=1 Tax=Aneurinibacillus soli TaxID=1500254 RepID=A0A0U5BGS6_9BACL|nr:alpha/beta hydrolase [Aneurinibacillus soli]PYE63677.1 pimeloyl-ACP methyl ester carboxylesterase [Aneurinibacillus soli]BAU27390.1 AB hydrolase superfamily protein YvaM [Aneurinibacillus soli]